MPKAKKKSGMVGATNPVALNAIKSAVNTRRATKSSGSSSAGPPSGSPPIVLAPQPHEALPPQAVSACAAPPYGSSHFMPAPQPNEPSPPQAAPRLVPAAPPVHQVEPAEGVPQQEIPGPLLRRQLVQATPLIKMEDTKHCTPCKTMDKKIESQYYCTDCEAYYCEECFELHPRVPYLAKHIVLKHDDIAVWSKLQYKCATHDKNLEFFCGEHKMLCCHVCVSLKHRSCADMEYILESTNNICLNDEIKTMIRRTQEKMDKIESYANKIIHKTEVNKKSKEEYMKELEKYRSRLNNMFDVLMKNALEEMNERVNRNTKYSEEMTRELKKIEKELQDLKHQLTTSTAGKEVLIYISLKRGENLVEEISKKLSEIDITTDKENFKPVLDNSIEEYVGGVKQIAYLEDEQMRQKAVSSKECEVQALVLEKEYQARISEDRECCSRCGMYSGPGRFCMNVVHVPIITLLPKERLQRGNNFNESSC